MDFIKSAAIKNSIHPSVGISTEINDFGIVVLIVLQHAPELVDPMHSLIT